MFFPLAIGHLDAVLSQQSRCVAHRPGLGVPGAQEWTLCPIMYLLLHTLKILKQGLYA
jgi:hypothetical protein